MELPCPTRQSPPTSRPTSRVRCRNFPRWILSNLWKRTRLPTRRPLPWTYRSCSQAPNETALAGRIRLRLRPAVQSSGPVHPGGIDLKIVDDLNMICSRLIESRHGMRHIRGLIAVDLLRPRGSRSVIHLGPLIGHQENDVRPAP